jgi:hypothetical protein
MAIYSEHGDPRAWVDHNRTDLRWQALLHGLSQLSSFQIGHILNWIDSGRSMAIDEFNYDSDRQLWCPLAVGLGVPNLIVEERLATSLNNERAKSIIREVGAGAVPGFTLNPLRGIPGRFFRQHRIRDLRAICNHLLELR